MYTAAAPFLELSQDANLWSRHSNTDRLLLLELQTNHSSQQQHGCFPSKGARWKCFAGSWAGMTGKNQRLVHLLPQEFVVTQVSLLHLALGYLKPDAMGQVCRVQFFFPAQDLSPAIVASATGWRLEAQPASRGLQSRDEPASSHRSCSGTSPCPVCCCPAARAPSSSGMRPRRKRAFNALCLGPKNVLPQAAQRSEVCYKQRRSEDFSQQRLQVLFVMETSRLAASSRCSRSCKCT